MTGGGFYDEELTPGLHYIVAKTTVGPWANVSAARQMWIDRADRLCRAPYQELEPHELVEEPRPGLRSFGMRYLVTVKKGYALCNWSGLSTEEVAKALTLRPLPR